MTAISSTITSNLIEQKTTKKYKNNPNEFISLNLIISNTIHSIIKYQNVSVCLFYSKYDKEDLFTCKYMQQSFIIYR